jgi:hypothetical protein
MHYAKKSILNYSKNFLLKKNKPIILLEQKLISGMLE